MKRSSGVTFSAIVLFGGTAILLAMSFAIAHDFLSKSSEVNSKFEEMAPFIKTFQFAFVLLIIGAAVAAFAAGVGLLRFKNWARILTLVLAALLLVVCLPALAITPSLPLDEGEQMSSHAILTSRIGLAAFYGFFCLLGGWWLYFLNTRAIKSQFQSPSNQTHTGEFPRSAVLPSVAVEPPPPPSFPPLNAAMAQKPAARPVSITIIAILFLISAGNIPMALAMYPVFHTPVPLFGSFIEGWPALLFMLTSGIGGTAAGIGLLKLKPWARTLAIYIIIFGILSPTVMMLRPGAMARFEQAMASVSFQFIPQQAVAGNDAALPQAIFRSFFHIVIRSTVIVGPIVGAIQLWFLVTRRRAFFKSEEQSTTSH